MFKFIAILASLVSVAAFAPVGRVATSSALKMSFDDALGAQPPLGFWDPLGILEDADEERFDRLRFVENKHGRISMLAILGHLVTTAGLRWDGEIAFGLPFKDVKTGLAAFDSIPKEGLWQIFFFIGFIELGFNDIREDLAEWCEEKFPALADDRRKAVELNNGRAAQMGILALMVHEKLDNNPYIINSLLGFPVAFN
eukprot:CAMPEP_0174955932 /NCGR_PEP_ID=MMETSP0004_2-20121128/1253_1 /TAXON_ID=420556 /ORGANISM="Ochromonas sp., Strain CCMP1393" /LENGTH=197 /DNA_ID=CAMNT_0016203909 /DNA_START=45 /DNA_END=638 /DNA_ORIENTATION=-